MNNRTCINVGIDTFDLGCLTWYFNDLNLTLTHSNKIAYVTSIFIREVIIPELIELETKGTLSLTGQSLLAEYREHIEVKL